MMRADARRLLAMIACLGTLCVAACGGGDPPRSSAAAAAANVVPVSVDAGPTSNSLSLNTLYTTVTVCLPGSSTSCQTIDHIQVDTGSNGLRIVASVLSLSFQVATAIDGNSLVECAQFADGYSWGPVATADVHVGGEIAGAVPVQIIGDSGFTAVPEACSSVGTAEDTVQSFGANGILGIGVFEQDCGAQCAANASLGFYYSCTASGSCAAITAPLSSQVANPVPRFANDNNGTLISLPAVAEPGAVTLTGSLTFGIDTRSNNASGNQTILTLDPDMGTFATIFSGSSLPGSFIDSGSSGIYFNDDNIAACSSSSGFTGFYCAATSQSFSATLVGTNNVSIVAGFTVDNAQTVSDGNPTYAVLPGLAGTFPGSTDTFDWGLPFYFGRRVATAIENHATAVETGPYVAF